MKKNTVADWRPDSRESFYRTLLDSIRNPIVFCNMDDRMVYMNHAAEVHYKKWGGLKILGQSVMDCHKPESRKTIAEIKEQFRKDPDLIELLYSEKTENRIWMRAVRENGELIGYYERYERPRDI